MSFSELRGFGGGIAYQMPLPGQVELDGIPLMLKIGTEYQVKSATPFAPKSSQGDPSYGDMLPFDSPSAQANWSAGYGFLRASRTIQSDAYSGAYWSGYFEGLNVDPAFPGRITISPPWVLETLPGLATTMTPAQCVELGGTLLCAAGTALYRRDDFVPQWNVVNGGTAFPAFPSSATDMAILGGTVFIALGDQQNMRYTSDLSTMGTTAPATCLTSDKVGLYRSFNGNQVQGSATGIGWAAEPVLTVGDTSAPITDLAPGGGLVLLWAGKTDGLWGIPTGAGGTATKYLPFERRYARNARPLLYHGPLLLVPNGRGLWSFQPSSQTSGEASNISPARDAMQIGRVRGEVRALGDSMRFVYAALVDNTFSPPQLFLNRMDTRTGHWHTWVYPGQGTCEVLFSRATDLQTVPGPPTLWFGFGNQIGRIGMPITNDDPLSDPNSRYNTSTTNVELISSQFDFNLPDADKDLLWVVLGAERLQGAVKYVYVDYMLDAAGIWQSDLTPAVAIASPSTQMLFTSSARCRQVQLRLRPRTFDPTDTPVIRYVVLHARILIDNRWRWAFTCTIAQNQQLENFAQRVDFAFTTFRKIMQIREDQRPVVYRDREGYSWTVLVDEVEASTMIESGGVQPEYAVKIEVTQELPGLVAGIGNAIEIPIPTDAAAVLDGETYFDP